jgi:uncharacterized small protein (DUF1192 family)
MAFILAPFLSPAQISREKWEKAMDPDDLEPRKKLPESLSGVVLGQDISTLSAHELEKRIARLEAEIARCKVAIGERNATKSAAESFFKK